jgi:flagellar biosynthesis protein FliR
LQTLFVNGAPAAGLPVFNKMISVTDAQLNAWLASLLWPLARILGLVMAAPVLGHGTIPARVKIGLGVFITLIIAPTLPPLPAVPLMSPGGLFTLIMQVLIGVAMGLVMRLAFSAVEAAGEIIGMQMGLGFASFYDPQSASNLNTLSSFLGLLASLAFLAINGHLLLLGVLAESFAVLPISAQPLPGSAMLAVAQAGSLIFSYGVQLALPLIAILLMTNLALAILTRSAPQLNIFAIGFPITLGVGLIGFDLSLPYLAGQTTTLFQSVLDALQQVVGSLAAR